MYQHWAANLTVAIATLMAVVISVVAHYEGLTTISKTVARKHRHGRINVLYAILGLLFLHVVEIWIFGLTLWGMLKWPACGSLSGHSPVHLFDAVYFSAATFSTVGYGDLSPMGPVRFLAGTESLVGLVLITWSASFTYLEMQRFWQRH